MNRFVADIEGRTEDNPDFRGVLYTRLDMQPVLIPLLLSEEIGEELQEHTDC